MGFKLPILFERLYIIFGIEEYTAQLILQFFLLVCVVAVVFRILLWGGYRAIHSGFLLQKKDINEKDDYKKIKYGFLSKTLKEYVDYSEKGAVGIKAVDIVKKEMLRSKILILSYDNLELFINTFEKSFLLIGFLITVILDASVSVATFFIAAYGVMLLLKILFNYSTIKERIIQEVSIYIEGNMSKFFVKDSISAIGHLKTELKTAITNQSNTIYGSINQLSINMTDKLSESLNRMDNNITKSADNFHERLYILEEPMKKWKETIEAAAEAQNQLNSIMGTINSSLENSEKISKVIDGGFKTLTDEMKSYFNDLGKNLKVLETLIQETKEYSDSYGLKNTALEKQLDFVESNQKVLAQSLNQYEVTLQRIAGQIGEGIGKTIDFHLQTAYESMNANIEENFDKIMNANRELLSSLEALFDKMMKQSMSEANAIISLKEQMDMNFEALHGDEK